MNKRLINKDGVSLLAFITIDGKQEIIFDFFPTDEELEKILVLVLKDKYGIKQKTAKALLKLFPFNVWAEVLDCFISNAIIEQVVGGNNLYEIWANEKHY